MKLEWMHFDCLNNSWLQPGHRSIYIFDDTQIDAAGWGIKRIGFIYETLIELPVEIHRGSTVETLLALAEESAATGIVTVDTPDPFLRRVIATLQTTISVEIVPPPAFVTLPSSTDLTRFSRYWRKAEPQLLA